MSGKNKVNPDHYKVAGRLSTDDLARARRQQSEPLLGAARRARDKPMPPWMLNDQHGGTEPVDSANRDAPRDGSEDKQAVSTAETPEARTRAKAETTTKTKISTGSATASKASRRPRTPRKTAKTRKVTNSRGSGGTPTTRAVAKKSAPSRAKKAPRRAAKKSTRAAAKKSTRPAAAKGSRKPTTRRKPTR